MSSSPNPAFEMIRSIPIDELQIHLTLLEHKKSGARIMHIEADDDENLFCLSLRTYPQTSNGVAHILEHTVLCGSEKYPVKDPFFSMIRRSLNTFMNALTGSDFTCYPAASCNETDFYNLLSVYLDATFFPKLRYMSFLQEGHRLEFTEPDDPTSLLTRRGIVYNEMKGVFASPTSRLYYGLMERLLPDTIYGIESGGDPAVIPELSHEGLIDFHKKYYDPGHALFFFYGNLPIEGHLSFLEENILNTAERPRPLEALKKQKLFTKPVKDQITYPIDSSEKERAAPFMAFGWLTCSITEPLEILALELITLILMENDASILKLALVQSGLCTDAAFYLETEQPQVPWVLILTGCKTADTDAVWSVIERCLKDLVEKGIEHHLIESCLHQLEFERLEITSSRGPYGLSLFMRAALAEQHGASSEETLKIHTLFTALRQEIKLDSSLLEEKISRYLLSNPHRVDLVATADEELSQKEAKAEMDQLSKINAKLSAQEKERIVKETKELSDFQEREEHADIDCLPLIAIGDISRDVKDFPLAHDTIGPYELFTHTGFTNGILYVDLVYDLPHISEEDLPYLRLFTDLVTAVGNKKRTWSRQLEHVQMHLGDLSCYLSLSPSAFDTHLLSPTLHIKASAIDSNAAFLFDILGELVCTTHFTEKERLRELIEQQTTALQTSLNQSALSYATSLASSGLSDATFLQQKFGGLDYYWFLSGLKADFEAQIDHVVKKLDEIKGLLFGSKIPHVVMSCSNSMLKKVHDEALFDLRFNEMKTKSQAWSGGYSLTNPLAQGRIISSGVFFTAKSIATPPYAAPESPACILAGHLFENITLHKKIREQGGAYGGGCRVKSSFGYALFFAYRDPHLASTLEAFDEAVATIASGAFTSAQLDEAKRAAIQAMDAPINPGSRAIHAYQHLRQQKSIEVRTAFRERLLDCTAEEVAAATQKYIAPHMKAAPSVAFGSAELFKKENEELRKLGREPLASFPV